MRGSVVAVVFALGLPGAARAAEVSWSTLPAMTTARSALAAAELGGLIYAIGGSAPGVSGAVERFTPGTGSWATVLSLSTPRSYLAAAVAGGKIYAIGGSNGSYLSTVEEYDPAANNWAPRASMTTARERLGAAVVSGLVYAVGGFNGGYLATNQQYNPGTDAWTAKTAMTYARQNPGVAAAGGKVYAAGGYNGAYLTFVEAYDPAGNAWTTVSSMPSGRSGFALVAAQGRLYAVGGTNGSYLNRVEEYDPATNTWAARLSLGTARSDLAAAAVSDSLYVAGGYNGAYLGTAERGALVDALALAADSAGLIWSTGGNASWFVESTVTHDGVDAIQSGNINNSQSSFIEATLTGPGSLTYYWKVSSESGYDYLRFFIDGVEQAGKISGTVDWTLKQFQITAGNHVLRWAYTKDASASVGSDAGWLDQVTWTPAGQASGGQGLGPEGLIAVAAPGVVIYPNVVDLSRNPSPVFRFRRGKAGAKITWTVFDGTGRSVRQGEAALDAAGDGSVVFDLLDEGGIRLAPGAYVVALSGGKLSGRRTPFLVVAKRAP